MKVLTKLKINEFVEMTDREMKFIIGGRGSGISAADECAGKTTYLTCTDYNDNGGKLMV